MITLILCLKRSDCIETLLVDSRVVVLELESAPLTWWRGDLYDLKKEIPRKCLDFNLMEPLGVETLLDISIWLFIKN